jgi:hypothetical protein
VEAAEQGTHHITVSDQLGCTIDHVNAGGRTYLPTAGSVTVPVAAPDSGRRQRETIAGG